MHRLHAKSFGGTNCAASGISRRGAVGPKKAAGRTVLHGTLCKQDIQDKSEGFLPLGQPGGTPRVQQTREAHIACAQHRVDP